MSAVSCQARPQVESEHHAVGIAHVITTIAWEGPVKRHHKNVPQLLLVSFALDMGAALIAIPPQGIQSMRVQQ